MAIPDCCAPLIAVLLIGGGALASAPKDKGPKDSAQSKTGASASREELLAALLAKGDAFAAKGEKHKASDLYSIAREYVADKRPVDAKLKSLGEVSLRGMTVQEADRLIRLTQKTPLDFENWPVSTADIERAELRILLDPRLVGDLVRLAMRVEGKDVGVDCFFSKPDMSIGDVLSTYGTPSSDNAKEDFRIVTYGRLRFVAEKSGPVVATLFRSRKQ